MGPARRSGASRSRHCDAGAGRRPAPDAVWRDAVAVERTDPRERSIWSIECQSQTCRIIGIPHRQPDRAGHPSAGQRLGVANCTGGFCTRGSTRRSAAASAAIGNRLEINSAGSLSYSSSVSTMNPAETPAPASAAAKSRTDTSTESCLPDIVRIAHPAPRNTVAGRADAPLPDRHAAAPSRPRANTTGRRRPAARSPDRPDATDPKAARGVGPSRKDERRRRR